VRFAKPPKARSRRREEKQGKKFLINTPIHGHSWGYSSEKGGKSFQTVSFSLSCAAAPPSMGVLMKQQRVVHV
jgi:hypothetical protein